MGFSPWKPHELRKSPGNEDDGKPCGFLLEISTGF